MLSTNNLVRFSSYSSNSSLWLFKKSLTLSIRCLVPCALHDDLVMSAAMAVFENGKLNVRNDLSHDSLIDQIKLAQQMQREQERKRRYFSW